MGDRIYDRNLTCGCMISSDGGGGVIPCCYGYGCGKKGCDEKKQCEDCIKQEKLCVRSWEEWKKSTDYKKHMRETEESNR